MYVAYYNAIKILKSANILSHPYFIALSHDIKEHLVIV